MKIPGCLIDDRLVLGALCRGSLRPREIAELPPRWWAHDEHPSLTVRVGGELHGELLSGIEALYEVHGSVKRGALAALVGHRSYVLELERQAPGRGAARGALARVRRALERRLRRDHEAHEAGREVVRGLGAALAAMPPAGRAMAMVGLAAGVHGGGSR